VRLRVKSLTQAEYRDGSEPNRSERSIRTDLATYRTVAHLWAAASHFINYEHCGPSAGVLNRTDLPYFLAVSEQYRVFGESWTPPRNPRLGPILDPANTWRVPPGTMLPEVEWTPRAQGELSWVEMQFTESS